MHQVLNRSGVKFVLLSIVLLGLFVFWGVLSSSDNTKSLQPNQFIQILKQNSDSQLLNATVIEISGYTKSERFIEGTLLNPQGEKIDYEVSLQTENHGKQINDLLIEYTEIHPNFEYKQSRESSWLWIP